MAENDQNFFKIFNINEYYSIDKSLLSKNYKELQKLVHPDKYVLNDKEVLLEAEKCSSLISNAYNILKDDFERANYLLKLKKYKYIEEGSDLVNDPVYLEVLLDVQEEIQNCETIEELIPIKNKIIEKINNIKISVCDSFDNNKIENVYELLKLMKFYLSLLNQADMREF